jgi:predicted kinase
MAANRNLIVLRGISGSGKSTVAKLFNAPVCCADDFMMVNGEYVFHASKLGYAHDMCKKKCKDLMELGIAKIVIANTNTTKAEMAPYAQLAKEHGYDVHYLIVENRRGGQNIHNVPQESLDKMRARFDVQL